MHARTHITNPTQADTGALAYQGLEIQQFRERLEDRRRKSLARSSTSFDLEDLEDELDEMITLASSSLRLHNECSTEIHRLTEVKMQTKFLAHRWAEKHVGAGVPREREIERLALGWSYGCVSFVVFPACCRQTEMHEILRTCACMYGHTQLQLLYINHLSLSHTHSPSHYHSHSHSHTHTHTYSS
jgi:hypothetical protein